MSRLGLAAGVVALLAAAVAVTVAVEHRLHGHGPDPHDHHDEHVHGHDGEGPEPGSGDGRVKLSPAALANAKLSLQKAGPGKVSVTLTLPGEVALNSERVAHVTPRVPGTVREVKKQLGESVKKGDALAVLDSRELADMQRDLLAAKERHTLAESNFKRQEQLFGEKIAAEKDYLAAKQALAEANIELRAASQKLSAGAGARGGGSGLVLTAPLDGTVIEKHAVVGEVLSDQRLAFVIADLSTLWVNVTVYAKDLPRVQAGQRALVRAEGIAEAAAGQVTYVDRVVGEQSRSAVARIVLDHPDEHWRSGLFVTADIAVEQVEAEVVIADDAVQRVDGQDAVFVQESDAFVVRPVVLGRQGFAAAGQRERFVEVRSGLRAGETYVANGSFLLKAELGKAEAGHEH